MIVVAIKISIWPAPKASHGFDNLFFMHAAVGDGDGGFFEVRLRAPLKSDFKNFRYPVAGKFQAKSVRCIDRKNIQNPAALGKFSFGADGLDAFVTKFR